MSRVSLDTNVLVYAADSRDRTRRERALSVIQTALSVDRVLTLQALAEFFYVATGKSGIDGAVARRHLGDWQTLFPVVAARPATLGRAVDVQQARRLNFWDALLLATCAEAGVTVLLTEDLQDKQVIEGVRCVNPFTRTTAELLRLMRA